MRLGLERQGWKIAFANDICQDKYEMYAAHFEDADDHFVVEDIHKLNADEVPRVTLATVFISLQRSFVSRSACRSKRKAIVSFLRLHSRVA